MFLASNVLTAWWYLHKKFQNISGASYYEEHPSFQTEIYLLLRKPYALLPLHYQQKCNARLTEAIENIVDAIISTCIMGHLLGSGLFYCLSYSVVWLNFTTGKRILTSLK